METAVSGVAFGFALMLNVIAKHPGCPRSLVPLGNVAVAYSGVGANCLMSGTTSAIESTIRVGR
jgi:hypothetical protein